MIGVEAGQLLFTTQDTSLLDSSRLSADAVWFVDEDRDRALTLYSLAEFDPRQLDLLSGHLEESYLEGRFGANPLLPRPGAVSRAAAHR